MQGARRLVVPLAALLVTLAATAIAFTFGPAEQGYFDSAFYVDGARHLARGDGYVTAATELAGDNHSQPITHWAPGTSLMIAAWIKLGFAPLTAAAIVEGVCYVAAALLIFLLTVALAGMRAWPLGVLGSMLYALQPSTLVWLDAVLSDLPWATFALASVLGGVMVMRADHPSLRLRVAFGILLWWVVLVRIAGLIFLPGLLAGVLLGMRWPGPLWKRPLHLWPSLLTAAVPIALWNLRNKYVADRPLGGWQFVSSDIATHLKRGATSAIAWYTDALRCAAQVGLEMPLRWLLLAAAVCLLPLVVFSARNAWRELTLVLLSALGYYGALVFTASVTMIALLTETRFWIVIWPLTWLAILIAVARAQPRWCIAPKAVVVFALTCVVGVYAHGAYRAAPQARQQRVTLHPAWARAAEALPDPASCFILVNDPRPFLLHRELPAIGAIPLSLGDFEAAIQRTGGKLCVVTTDASKRLRLSSSAERRRRGQNAVIDALKSQNRLVQTDRRAGVTVYRVH